MQIDFHYFATYCAALLAGYSEQESSSISYGAQLPDECTSTMMGALGCPLEAATTQGTSELANVGADLLSIQNATRTWSSFHFLPRDLNANVSKGNKRYKNKYRLICGPNGQLVADTVELAKGRGPMAIGIAMHVLADTWAHRGFAGTPSLVINNVADQVIELVPKGNGFIERPVSFRLDFSNPDDFDQGHYINAPFYPGEISPVNLGHGRMGHLPDLSFMRYRYLPAWGDYEEIFKDNPAEYYKAFAQMVQALQYLHGDIPAFELNTYETHLLEPWEERIRTILETRQLDSSEDWRALGAEISGTAIEDLDLEAIQNEYRVAPPDDKGETSLGLFVMAALRQKSMVTNAIYKSGNSLAGKSIEYDGKKTAGIRDYLALITEMGTGE